MQSELSCIPPPSGNGEYGAIRTERGREEGGAFKGAKISETLTTSGVDAN